MRILTIIVFALSLSQPAAAASDLVPEMGEGYCFWLETTAKDYVKGSYYHYEQAAFARLARETSDENDPKIQEYKRLSKISNEMMATAANFTLVFDTFCNETAN